MKLHTKLAVVRWLFNGLTALDRWGTDDCDDNSQCCLCTVYRHARIRPYGCFGQGICCPHYDKICEDLGGLTCRVLCDDSTSWNTVVDLMGCESERPDSWVPRRCCVPLEFRCKACGLGVDGAQHRILWCPAFQIACRILFGRTWSFHMLGTDGLNLRAAFFSAAHTWYPGLQEVPTNITNSFAQMRVRQLLGHF